MGNENGIWCYVTGLKVMLDMHDMHDMHERGIMQRGVDWRD
jgi:hypothetical protein